MFNGVVVDVVHLFLFFLIQSRRMAFDSLSLSHSHFVKLLFILLLPLLLLKVITIIINMAHLHSEPSIASIKRGRPPKMLISLIIIIFIVLLLWLLHFYMKICCYIAFCGGCRSFHCFLIIIAIIISSSFIIIFIIFQPTQFSVWSAVKICVASQQQRKITANRERREREQREEKITLNSVFNDVKIGGLFYFSMNYIYHFFF